MFPTQAFHSPPNHCPMLVQRHTRHLPPVKGGNLLHVLWFYLRGLDISSLLVRPLGFSPTHVQNFLAVCFVPTLHRQTYAPSESPSEDDLRGGHIVLRCQLFDHGVVADQRAS
jgi:hypothetical protein